MRLSTRHLVWVISLTALLVAGAAFVGGCSWIQQEDIEKDNTELAEKQDRDPLPGELVAQTLKEDSLRTLQKIELKKNMTKVVQDYRSRFREEYFTGYFLTDFDKDGLPELWVKIGNHRDNSRLELYFPQEDGTLKKTYTVAEPGKYYIGDDYMIQAVGAGAGFINVNKLSIYNGAMDVEVMKELDMLKDPDARIPKFKEREIRSYSLGNITPILNAL